MVLDKILIDGQLVPILTSMCKCLLPTEIRALGQTCSRAYNTILKGDYYFSIWKQSLSDVHPHLSWSKEYPSHHLIGFLCHWEKVSTSTCVIRDGSRFIEWMKIVSYTDEPLRGSFYFEQDRLKICYSCNQKMTACIAEFEHTTTSDSLVVDMNVQTKFDFSTLPSDTSTLVTMELVSNDNMKINILLPDRHVIIIGNPPDVCEVTVGMKQVTLHGELPSMNSDACQLLLEYLRSTTDTILNISYGQSNDEDVLLVQGNPFPIRNIKFMFRYCSITITAKDLKRLFECCQLAHFDFCTVTISPYG